MSKFDHELSSSAALTAAVTLMLMPRQTNPAVGARSVRRRLPSRHRRLPPPPPTAPSPPPAVATASHAPPPTARVRAADSINGLAKQRFNQMITNRVLGTVLLGVNEQVNCSDCVSAFGSAGSFSAGVHGRKELTPNLSLLAGIAYTQYSEGGYNVTSAPIGAFALRYDFIDWGSSRPFFDIGTILSPFEKVSYSRSYVTSLGAVALNSPTNSSDYAVYGRAGWISRLLPRDEVAASVELWQMWQRVSGYSDPSVAFNPFNASIATGTDRTNLVKVGGQWTHLFGSSIETNINGGFVQSFSGHSGIVATVTGDGTDRADNRQPELVRIWRPRRFPHHQGLGCRPLRQRNRGPAAGRQHPPWRGRIAGQLLGRDRLDRNGFASGLASPLAFPIREALTLSGSIVSQNSPR